MDPAPGNQVQRFWRTWLGVLVGGILAASLPGAPPSEAQPLTTARQVRSLTREEANRHYPVVLRGVVTFRNKDGFFLHDGTEAVFTDEPALADRINPGDFVELAGSTALPDFAPQVNGNRVTVLGAAPLPVPLRPTFEQMVSSELDSQWIEIEGIVHAARLDEGNPAVEVLVSGGNVLARVRSMTSDAAAHLVDSRVRIRGNCGAIYNKKKPVAGSATVRSRHGRDP